MFITRNKIVLLPFAPPAQIIKDWENPQLVSQNAMRPHAHLIPFYDEQNELQKTTSSFIQ